MNGRDYAVVAGTFSLSVLSAALLLAGLLYPLVTS
jgi:hypothetical protein